MNILLEVAVPGPFSGGLDYELPINFLENTDINSDNNTDISLENLSKMLCGSRVQVPLGKKQVTGVILKVKSSLNLENLPTKTSLRTFILKPMTQILDSLPLYQGSLLKLIEWISLYYHHPIGDTFQTALIGALSNPEPLLLEPLTTYTLTETGRINKINSVSARSPHQQKLLDFFHEFSTDSFSFSLEDLKKLNPEIPSASLKNALKSLLQKNWIQETQTLPTLPESKITDLPKTLTAEQEEALKLSLEKNTFHIQCLEGVTGSGKTEIYLQRIAPLLAKGQQVLILVPEIGLTPQTLRRFESRFKYPVIALHSGLNPTERKTAIYHAFHGNAKIIIGTRSAVFIPLKNLGMIIVDEEHDLSFKQQNGLRYHARDVAIKRAQLEDIPILLGSATLSLETLHNALSQKYLHLKLSARPQESTLPELHCINLKAQKNLVDGLSQPLIQAIKKHLETPFPNQAKNQILLFINRRGFAPMMMCHECGWQAICPRCDKPYTLHIHPTRLSCHHCEVQKNILSHCPECDSQAPLSDVGIGTEKIELALQTLFPDRKILRIDRTNTTKKNSMEKHLAQIESGEADILVGTQMLAKGHHFENLSMVGVIKIDDALFSNDFRSSEHLGQLLTQVAGRAGREKTQGEVYIQTHHIDHPLLNLLLTEGYSNYAKALLEERKATNFPPFSYLALIRAEGHSLEQNHQALREIKSHLQNFSNALYAKHSGILPPTTPQENPLNCLGPFPAFLAKKGGIYRSQLLIQSQERKILHQTLNQLQIFLKQNPIKKIRIFFDIDPIELD